MQMLDPSIAAARMYSNSSRFIEAYHAVLQPLCREAELPALQSELGRAAGCAVYDHFHPKEETP